MEDSYVSAKRYNNSTPYPVDELIQKPRFGKCTRLKLSPDEVYACTVAEIEKFTFEYLKYPPKALKKKQEGEVEVSFVVAYDGEVKNVTATGKYPLLNKETEQLILLMNESELIWAPRKIDGRRVETLMTTKVNFVLSEWEK